MQINEDVLREEYRKAVDGLNRSECWREWSRQASLRKAMEAKDG